MTAKSSLSVHCARTVKITFVGYNHIIFRVEFSINYLWQLATAMHHKSAIYEYYPGYSHYFSLNISYSIEIMNPYEILCKTRIT